MKTTSEKVNEIVINSNEIIQAHLDRSRSWIRAYKGQPQIYKCVVDMEKTAVLCKITNKLPPISDTILNALIVRVNGIWDKEIYNK